MSKLIPKKGMGVSLKTLDFIEFQGIVVGNSVWY
jgi:hypothetical protein